MRINIVEIGCGHCTRDALLYPNMKWTGPMLYTQRFAADQKFPEKRVKAKCI